ncbi:MAG: hypothetical protein ACLGJC_13965 [Alphaproteobacteria bacterium]
MHLSANSGGEVAEAQVTGFAGHGADAGEAQDIDDGATGDFIVSTGEQTTAAQMDSLRAPAAPRLAERQFHLMELARSAEEFSRRHSRPRSSRLPAMTSMALMALRPPSKAISTWRIGLQAHDATSTGPWEVRTTRSRFDPGSSSAKSAASPRLPTTITITITIRRASARPSPGNGESRIDAAFLQLVSLGSSRFVRPPFQGR